MTIKERVAAALDAPPVRAEEKFREILAQRRLERSTFGRMCSLVLRIGHGPVPCKALVKEAVRRDLLSYMPVLIEAWREFCGESVDLADLMPGPEAKRPGKAPAIPMPGKKFTGVSLAPSGKWAAFIEISGKTKSLGVFADPHQAALEYDKAARANPSPSGKPRKLNFTVAPLACTPEPVTRQISLERAA